MDKFSVVTLVKGRRQQLRNLLMSIKESVNQPYDIHIVFMDAISDFQNEWNLPIDMHQMDSVQQLPLAAARNRGIEACKTDQIIFIDVDCIVSPTLFGSILAKLNDHKIISAYPLYLSTLPYHGHFNELEKSAIPHPARENLQPETDISHLQFWSLIFGVKMEIFRKIGGFDETFTGYGAEDTDFAMSFNQVGIKLQFVKDFVLHQYHEKYDPPLNYFETIIDNAIRFEEKWNFYPMKSWLRSFEEKGLIKIENNDTITIIAKPSQDLINLCKSVNPY